MAQGGVASLPDSGDGEELTPREFPQQRTDDKAVGAYRTFSGDNASNPNMANLGEVPASQMWGPVSHSFGQPLYRQPSTDLRHVRAFLPLWQLSYPFGHRA